MKGNFLKLATLVGSICASAIITTTSPAKAGFDHTQNDIQQSFLGIDNRQNDIDTESVNADLVILNNIVLDSSGATDRYSEIFQLVKRLIPSLKEFDLGDYNETIDSIQSKIPNCDDQVKNIEDLPPIDQFKLKTKIYGFGNTILEAMYTLGIMQYLI